MCEVKLLSKNTKAEQWINDYLIYQKSRLTIKSKKESPDSSSMSSLRENDEDDFMDLEDAKSNSETKVEDAYDFVDDSTSDKIKKCPYCDGFVGKNLRVHIMRHKGIKPYKCHYCDYDAVTMIEVRLHQRRSHKTLPINVVSKNDENSNKEIDIPKQLKYARKNIKQYVCTVCKTHVTRLNIADHKSICHPNSTTELILLKNSDVLVCSICNAYAVNEPLMNDHFKASHPGAAIIYKNEKLGKKGTKLFRRFSCKYCLTNYIEYSELLDHFQKNHKEIPIQIVAYTTSNARTTGETTIKEDLKCIITGCDSTLKTPLDLLFHVRCHYESYYCEPCSLLFNSHSKYSNHPCPKGAVIPKNKIGGAILNQRLPQIYQILSQIYGADLKSVTCEDYLSNVDRPDVTDVIEIRKPGEPLPKKLKQVAKKSTTQVNPQHLKFI